MSCDLVPRSGLGKHLVQDAMEVIYKGSWDLIIAHPPCTYLAKAGLHWNQRVVGRTEKTVKAVSVVKMILASKCPLICVENPLGALGAYFRPPDQVVHPHFFGSEYKKETGLWLKGLPVLLRTHVSDARKSVLNHVNGRMSQDQKAIIKSKFFPEFASAMVSQWSIFL